MTWPDRLRLERGVEHLHALGARATAELFGQLAADCPGAMPAILGRLAEYQRLIPAMIRAAGGDRFPPRPLIAVPDMRKRGLP
jgi:hypothetical protein